MSASHKVEIVPIGAGLGFAVPGDIAKKWDIRAGDEVYLTETPNGIEISLITAAMRRAMEENRDVPSRLAQS